MLTDQSKFEEYVSQGYTRIPLMRKVLADLDTPLSTYLKLASGAHSYLFESVQGGEKWGRYSIIGLPCHTIFRVHGDTLTVERHGELVESKKSRGSVGGGAQTASAISGAGGRWITSVYRWSGGVFWL